MKKLRPLIIFGVTFLCIAAGFVYVQNKFYQEIGKPIELELNSETDMETVDMEITLNCVNSWVSKKSDKTSWIGAEFDGVILNKMDTDCYDWKLTIHLPEEIVIDSSWNGEYDNYPDVVILTPDDNINMIPAGEEKTFGFVVYSDHKMVLDEFSFTGYKYGEISSNPTFKILVWVAIIWGISLIAYLLAAIRFRALEKRRIHDEKIIDQTMHMFAEMIDAKDTYTRQHSRRVAYYSKKIGECMNLSQEELQRLGYISLLHDCGKVAVPDSILMKNGPLTEKEREVIERHTTVGAAFLENIDSIEGIREGALYHHERYDGMGYPERISGNSIPLFARIICIADAFDAMNSDRCYRKRLPKEVILNELKENAGTQFDPEIVRHMIKMVESGEISVGGNYEGE